MCVWVKEIIVYQQIPFEVSNQDVDYFLGLADCFWANLAKPKQIPVVLFYIRIWEKVPDPHSAILLPTSVADPDPWVSFPWIRIRIKKSLDPESGSLSNYTDLPHCCQLFVRVGHCVLLRSARNVLKRNVFFSIFLRKVCKVRNILLGFISCKKFEKRTLKFFDSRSRLLMC